MWVLQEKKCNPKTFSFYPSRYLKTPTADMLSPCDPIAQSTIYLCSYDYTKMNDSPLEVESSPKRKPEDNASLLAHGFYSFHSFRFP